MNKLWYSHNSPLDYCGFNMSPTTRQNTSLYIWTQPNYTVSVYILTQLTEGNTLGIYLDPAQLQHHCPIPAPKSHSSQVSIRITSSALDCGPLSSIRVTSDVAWVFTSWPSPLLHPSPSTESESISESYKDFNKISLCINFKELFLVLS